MEKSKHDKISEAKKVLSSYNRMKLECDCENAVMYFCGVQAAANNDRLKAYEDTGLTPEEITTMKAEYSDTFQAHLNELLDIKDRRIAELESENKRLIEIIKENKS